MGLLDNLLGTSFDDPKTAATMQLAQGLLSAPRAMQGLSGGLLGYQQQLAQAKQQQAMDEMRKMQLAQHALALKQAQQAAEQSDTDRALTRQAFTPIKPVEANAASGIAGPRPEALGVVGQLPKFDPAQFIGSGGAAEKAFALQQALQKEQPKLEKIGPGEVAGSWQNGQFKPVYTAPAKDDSPSALKEYNFARSQGYQGSFLEFQLAQKRAGATAITVDRRGDNAYSAAQGKEYSDLMAGINKAGFQAPSQIRKLERMTQLLDGIEGGKLSPVGLEAASMLNSLGIKVDPKLGNKEAAQALSRELAGGLRAPGTGPMTDKDFENFLQQIPDLSKSAQGRKQISATMTAALNRDMKISQMAREYEKRNGRIDGGFMDEIASFIAENPVVAAPGNWMVQR